MLYGTVSHFKVRPGMRSVFLAWANYSSWTTRNVPGMVDSIVFQMDRNPHEFMIAVYFESEEAYRANAESKEQHEEYLHMLEFLAGPPEWNDGAIIWYS